MVSPKAFLCRCEDITVQECQEAIHGGYGCFEDLKRFLGVGTGPCQGKACVAECVRLIADQRGIPVAALDTMTFRPPVRPVSFATLAAPDAGMQSPQGFAAQGGTPGLAGSRRGPEAEAKR